MKARKSATAVGVLVAAALALAGCSGNDDKPTAGTPSSSTNEKVTLTFVNWDGGMDKVVDEWNKLNPNIQVKLSKPSGTGYTLYNKLITNNKAGTNPDVTEVEYQALPALIANQVVAPIDDYVKDLASKYDKSALSQVQFEGKTYGVPQNVCPMVFFYRKDVFDKLGIKPPKTWDEYATARRPRSTRRTRRSTSETSPPPTPAGSPGSRSKPGPTGGRPTATPGP